jgi:hypothetical protein
MLFCYLIPDFYNIAARLKKRCQKREIEGIEVILFVVVSLDSVSLRVYMIISYLFLVRDTF